MRRKIIYLLLMCILQCLVQGKGLICVSYYSVMMVMMIHMVISALSFEVVLTKSRCVAAVIQDATSKPYTINIRMKYWKGNKWNTRITSTSKESFLFCFVLFLQITVMFSAAHSPKYNYLIIYIIIQ